VIRAHRAGTRRAPEGSFLARVADADLDVRLAAVELGNVLRPTVAVAWLGVGAAQALLEHPDRARRLADDDAARERAAFAHEVRRTTPFVPVLAGRVRVPRADGPDGTVLRQRDRVVLDVRGTHFRPDLHEHPLRFDPERFLDVEPGPFEVLAQGGGDLAGHRCPGERLTLALLEETVRVLARHQLTPTREPVLDPTRIPPLPAGGLEVRVAGMATEPGGTAVIDSRGTVGEHPR
jgi:fatty-acid peroxygenase